LNTVDGSVGRWGNFPAAVAEISGTGQRTVIRRRQVTGIYEVYKVEEKCEDVHSM